MFPVGVAATHHAKPLPLGRLAMLVVGEAEFPLGRKERMIRLTAIIVVTTLACLFQQSVYNALVYLRREANAPETAKTN